MTTTAPPLPPARYIGSDRVMGVLADHGRHRLELLDSARILALALLAGTFITTGALLSMVLATGTTNAGMVRLIEGLAFSAGFFFVILSGAVLFTETNVVLPAVLLRNRRPVLRVLRFWALAWIGNLLGALAAGHLMAIALDLSPASLALLEETVAAKTAATGQGAGAWWSVVVSGVLLCHERKVMPMGR